MTLLYDILLLNQEQLIIFSYAYSYIFVILYHEYHWYQTGTSLPNLQECVAMVTVNAQAPVTLQKKVISGVRGLIKYLEYLSCGTRFNIRAQSFKWFSMVLFSYTFRRCILWELGVLSSYIVSQWLTSQLPLTSLLSLSSLLHSDVISPLWYSYTNINMKTGY